MNNSKDQESFDAFVEKVLNDDKEILAVEAAIKTLIYDFISKLLQQDEITLKLLQEKREKGKIEHGSPLRSQIAIVKEVNQEIMDAFVWYLMAVWNKKRRKEENDSL